MTYITSIGLDVHARSVSACAFDPFTGEVAQRRFGTDAGEIAEWIPGFESPKAVYGSGCIWSSKSFRNGKRSFPIW